MADLGDNPEHPERTTRGRAHQRLTDNDEGADRLKAALASGPVVSIPLTGAAESPDPASLQPVDPALLGEMLGRQPTDAELPVAPAMLADAMAWAADPTRRRQFLEAELHAWTTAYAGVDADTNPYTSDHPDKDLRTVGSAHTSAHWARRHEPGTPHRRLSCREPSGSGTPAAETPMAR